MSGHDPYDLRGQALAQEERKDKEQALQALWESDVKWLMSGKRGRRVAFRFLEQARVLQPVFNANNSVMSHLEGRRDLGLYLLNAILATCPEAFHLMLEEHRDKT